MAKRTRPGRELIGTIGVDAGMCYLGDPCYIAHTPLGHTGDDPDDTHWREFLHGISDPDTDYMSSHANVMGALPSGFPIRAGVCVHTGWGDGEYPVYVTRNKEGRIASVTIEFITDEE